MFTRGRYVCRPDVPCSSLLLVSPFFFCTSVSFCRSTFRFFFLRSVFLPQPPPLLLFFLSLLEFLLFTRTFAPSTSGYPCVSCGHGWMPTGLANALQPINQWSRIESTQIKFESHHITSNRSQVSDAVTAFLKLFCGSAKIHQRRANKSGKSIAYYQVRGTERQRGRWGGRSGPSLF